MSVQSYRTPPKLRPGDGVALVSLSRPLTEAALMPVRELLRRRGYRVVYGRTIGAQERCFAGPADVRAADFSEMLADPAVRAVWLARGGYGAVEVLDRIRWEPLADDPKWIVGFSDVTAVHMHVHRKCRIPTLHATMPVMLRRECPRERHAFEAALTVMERGAMPPLSWPAWPWNRQGTAEGVLVGGNLSVLASLMGSPSDIEPAGKILFLEDVDEYLYHIDRLMVMLRRAGVLEKLGGLVVGGMTRMKDNDPPNAIGRSAYELIAERVADDAFPVAFGAPVGHFPGQHPLMLGAPYRLEVTSSETHLRCLINAM